MDPTVIQTGEVPLVVVVSSVVTLCLLVVTTVWMCWRMKAGLSSQSNESDDTDELKLPENDSPTDTPKTEDTELPQDDQDEPPDEDNNEEEPEEEEEDNDS